MSLLTDEDIKELLGPWGPWGDGPVTGYTRDLFDRINEFATLARAAALEEAAGVCDNSASQCQHDGLLQLVLKSNAAAIRAMKEQT